MDKFSARANCLRACVYKVSGQFRVLSSLEWRQFIRLSNPYTFYISTYNPGRITFEVKEFSTEINRTNGYPVACSDTFTVIISYPAADAGSNQTIFNGCSASIGAAAVSGDTYSWYSSPSGFTSTLSSATVNPSYSTSYILTEAVTATGCTNDNEVSITVSTANVGSTKTICFGSSTTVGASAISGNTYSWTSSPSGFTSTASNPTVSPTTTTTYTLTETITATGCSNTESVTVTVDTLPTANAGANKAECKGYSGSVSLGATSVSGDTYSWTSNPGGFTSTVSSPGVSPTATTTYYLKETITSTGCHKTDSVIVTINPLPPADVTPSQVVCPDSFTVIGDNPAGSIPGDKYFWSYTTNGHTWDTLKSGSPLLPVNKANPGVNPSVTTKYKLIEVDTLTGCSNKDSATLTMGTNSTTYGTSPFGSPTTDGWYIRAHHCDSAVWDVEIWGNTATYGNFSIVEGLTPFTQKPYFYINCSVSGKRSKTYSSTNAIVGIINSVTVDGGKTVTLTGGTQSEIDINYATTANTNVTFNNFNDGGTVMFVGPIVNPLLTTGGNHVSTLLSPLYYANVTSINSNFWGSFSFFQGPTQLNYATAVLNGTFNFYDSSWIEIPWGNELYINNSETTVLQGIKNTTGTPVSFTNVKYNKTYTPAGTWMGIGAYGTDRANPTLASDVTSKEYPYLGYYSPGQYKWVRVRSKSRKGPPWINVLVTIVAAGYYPNHYQQGAVVITSGVKIIDAVNRFNAGGIHFPGGVNGNCGAIVIAQGASFQNTNVTLGGWDPQNYANGKVVYERYGSISYFNNDSFTASLIPNSASNVTLNEITFGKQNNTFQNCVFNSVSASDTAGIKSHSSVFTAYYNKFLYIPTGIYIADDASYEEDIIGNVFSCSQIGLWAVASKKLFVEPDAYGNRNIFFVHSPTIGQPNTGIGLFLDGCTFFEVYYNLFHGWPGQSATGTGVQVYNSVRGNFITRNTFSNLSIGAYNYYYNDSLQYLCNTFDSNAQYDILVTKYSPATGKAYGSVSYTQGRPGDPAGNTFSHKCPLIRLFPTVILPTDFAQPLGNRIIKYYYSTGGDAPRCYQDVKDTPTGYAIGFCDWEPFKLGTGSGDGHGTGVKEVLIKQLHTVQNQLATIALPPASRGDTDDYNFLTEEIQVLVPQIVRAYAMDTSMTDSMSLDSSIAFLQSQNTLQSIEMLTDIYVAQGDSLHTAGMLTQVQDSISVHPSDSELVNYANYNSMSFSGQQYGWYLSTLENDSASMQAIAHSNSSVAGNAQTFLQHYFEDIPLALSKIPVYDSVFSDYQDEYTSTTQDSATFKVTFPIQQRVVDSIVYQKTGGGEYSLLIPLSGPAIHNTKDSGQFAVYHPGLRSYTDSIVVPVNHHVTDASQDSVALLITHTILDTPLFSHTRAFCACRIVPITDSITASNHDSLAYYASGNVHYAPSFYTHHYLTDSSVNYATHYSADTVTDSIMYHTFFYSSLSDNPLYDTSLYYNFHYSNTGVYDSTTNTTVVHTVGAVTDSTIYTTVYNTIDSVADTTLYFTESFKTVYSAESWEYVPETISVFPWKYLFPHIPPPVNDSDTTSAEGGGFGMVRPQGLPTVNDTDLQITIAPNPFSNFCI